MDDFDLISVIGSGTCGEVSKMKHNPTGKILAVKVSYGWRLKWIGWKLAIDSLKASIHLPNICHANDHIPSWLIPLILSAENVPVLQCRRAKENYNGFGCGVKEPRLSVHCRMLRCLYIWGKLHLSLSCNPLFLPELFYFGISRMIIFNLFFNNSFFFLCCSLMSLYLCS